MQAGPERRRPPRRGYELVSAVDPADGELTEAYVSHARMDAVAQWGMGAAKDLAFSQVEVLQAPKAIFRGVREEGERNWLCCVGIPKHSYTKEGHTRPPREDRVFLVYVNDDWVAYNCRWDECGPDCPQLPLNYKTRFDERVR